jgi:hypothetical protein
MEQYITSPEQEWVVGEKTIYVFSGRDKNIDPETVASFGYEWSKFLSKNASAGEIPFPGNNCIFVFVRGDPYQVKK